MTYRRTSKEHKNVYDIVTERIMRQMENGIIPWRKPWNNAKNIDGTMLATNAISGEAYSLTNQFLLGMQGGKFLTYKQITEHGGKLKEDAERYMVIWWNRKAYEKKDNNGNVIIGEDGKPEMKIIPILKYYTVYSLEDTEGVKLPKKKERKNTPIMDAETIITDYVTASGIKFDNTGSNRAFYRPSEDMVVVPSINQYKDTNEYYSTTFHEFIHSTGHESRLNRLTNDFFGGHEYSKEELVAELGSAFTMAICGIETPKTETNSAAYIQSWLKELNNDHKLFVSAASMAQKAVKFMIPEDTAETIDNEEQEEPAKVEQPKAEEPKEETTKVEETKTEKVEEVKETASFSLPPYELKNPFPNIFTVTMNGETKYFLWKPSEKQIYESFMKKEAK